MKKPLCYEFERLFLLFINNILTSYIISSLELFSHWTAY
jgi:hypothetical protein